MVKLILPVAVEVELPIRLPEVVALVGAEALAEVVVRAEVGAVEELLYNC